MICISVDGIKVKQAYLHQRKRACLIYIQNIVKCYFKRALSFSSMSVVMLSRL